MSASATTTTTANITSEVQKPPVTVSGVSVKDLINRWNGGISKQSETMINGKQKDGRRRASVMMVGEYTVKKAAEKVNSKVNSSVAPLPSSKQSKSSDSINTDKSNYNSSTSHGDENESRNGLLVTTESKLTSTKSSVDIKSDGDESLDESEKFPLYGIELLSFLRFIDELNLGDTYTLDDFVKATKDMTLERKESISEYFLRNNPESIKPVADCFITPSWLFRMQELVESLHDFSQSFDSVNNKVFIWISAVSLSHHRPYPKESFDSAVSKHGKSLAVLYPYDESQFKTMQPSDFSFSLPDL